jgi:hypothetical protein
MSYRLYEPDQVMLLPTAPQEWPPLGRRAHFIKDTVDALDLKGFSARHEDGGSSKIERRLHRELSFRMPPAGNIPRYGTICDFRAPSEGAFGFFVQVVKLAREMSLVKIGTVAIDGTKVKAKAAATR